LLCSARRELRFEGLALGFDFVRFIVHAESRSFRGSTCQDVRIWLVARCKVAGGPRRAPGDNPWPFAAVVPGRAPADAGHRAAIAQTGVS
jgi:hypothetical protein